MLTYWEEKMELNNTKTSSLGIKLRDRDKKSIKLQHISYGIRASLINSSCMCICSYDWSNLRFEVD